MHPESKPASPQGAPRPFKRVIVAVDAGGASMKAVDYASRLCSPQSHVLVLGFFEDPAAYLKPHSRTQADVSAAFEELRRDELEALEHARTTLQRSGASVQLRLLGPALGKGEISAGLARVAQEWNADLVIVGAEPSAGILSLLASKVSVSLAEHTHRAILVVPSVAEASTLRMPQRILFAVDGSEASLHAVRVGMQLAPARAHLMAMFIEDRGVDLAELRKFVLSPAQDVKSAENVLDRAVAIMTEYGAGMAVERLVSHTRMTEDVAAAIKREAAQWGADIVVIGAQDRGGMFSWFRGHENERVAREIDRPLLVVNVAG